MSKEDVKKYFQMLTEDQDFVKKIADTGEDKKAKMEVIKSYGMNFTKKEFIEIGKELYQKYYTSDGELNDEALQTIAGGGIGGFLLGGILGAIGGEVLGLGLGATGGTLIGAKLAEKSKAAGISIGITTAASATGAGAAVGAAIGAGVGAFLPF